jgi:hypothetical protein
VNVYESKTGGLALDMTLPNGTKQTFQILEGQLLDPATGSPASIPAPLIGELNRIFTALKTLYIEQVNFTFDRTITYVSPTTGLQIGQGLTTSDQFQF